jgi:mRNA interferase RelE/StbE
LSYRVLATPTFEEMLGAIENRRTRQQIFAKARGLAEEPEQQGKPLEGPLKNLRSIHAAGRYRIIYKVCREVVEVHLLTTGIRKDGSQKDIYALTKKLVRLGLLSG